MSTLFLNSRRFTSVFIAGFLLMSFGGGCQTFSVSQEQQNDAKHTRAFDRVSEWRTVDVGVERREYPISSSTQATIILYRIDPQRYSFHWSHSDSPRTLSEWKEQNPSAKLILNGVYFWEDHTPAGDLIIQGQSVVKGRMFDLDKSAYLVLQPSVEIVDTKYRTLDTRPIEAAQSYPLLISDGKPGFTRMGTQTARRTFVGTDEDGHVYVGIIAYADMTLYDVMHTLLSMDISWKYALNLDGGPSSGLVAAFEKKSERIPSYVGIPNVLIIESK